VARKVSLTVNNNPIKLDYFVESYVYHVTNGIVASLKNTGPIKKLALDVDKTDDIKMDLNGNDIPLNFFTTEIVRNTLAGMVANLKGVEGKPKTISIKIEQ
jgi:hypothetical protein